MENNTAYFDLTMVCQCPKCKREIDLDAESHDDKTWVNLFKKWINNDPELKKVNQEVECDCGHVFRITSIER